MAQLDLNLALHLLTRKKPWTDRSRMDGVATALSLLGGNWLKARGDAHKVVNATVDGMAERRYGVDSKLVRDLYASCPRPLKLTLVGTVVFPRLEPNTFKSLFLEAYRLRPTKLSEQLVLAYALEFFIHLNEKRAHEYKGVIVSFLRSPKPSLCFRGLYQAGYLNDLEPGDLELMRKNLCKRSFMRTHAMNGFRRLLMRRREVSPRVLAFCLSPEIKAKTEHLSTRDPDDFIRDYASSLLQAIREARQDVRTLRKLKAAGYPLP